MIPQYKTKGGMGPRLRDFEEHVVTDGELRPGLCAVAPGNARDGDVFAYGAGGDRVAVFGKALNHGRVEDAYSLRTGGVKALSKRNLVANVTFGWYCSTTLLFELNDIHVNTVDQVFYPQFFILFIGPDASLFRQK